MLSDIAWFNSVSQCLVVVLTLLLDLLQDHVNDKYCPRPTNSSTAKDQQFQTVTQIYYTCILTDIVMSS